MYNTIKEEALRYVNEAVFGYGEKGILKLTKECLIWTGKKNDFNFKFEHISNV